MSWREEYEESLYLAAAAEVAEAQRQRRRGPERPGVYRACLCFKCRSLRSAPPRGDNPSIVDPSPE